MDIKEIHTTAGNWSGVGERWMYIYKMENHNVDPQLFPIRIPISNISCFYLDKRTNTGEE